MRHHFFTFVIALVAAAIGGAIGCRVMMPHPATTSDIQAALHHTVSLDAKQEAALDQLEARFAVTRATLEAQMRADNAQLAAAIEAEHGDGPQVSAAVDASHRTMGQLQKATLAHVFAMRRLLRADQAAAFDRVVVQALTDAK